MKAPACPRRSVPKKSIGRPGHASSSPALAWSPGFERLENRCVLSGFNPFTIGAVTLPADPSVQVSGTIGRSGGQQLYQVTLDTQGLLVATVNALGAGTLLSLQDQRGNVLIQSQGSSPTNPEDRLAQQLPAGTYALSVSDSTSGGNFSLSTTFTRSLPSGQALNESAGAYSVATADLTGDGKSDLIVPNYYYNQILINYGVGDGTFQPPVAIPVGVGPKDVLAADLFGDGHIDLVVVDQLSNDIMILKGDGQGNFQVAQVLPTRLGPVQVVDGDFSGDGRLDLAVSVEGGNGVEIFQNQANGTFVESNWIGSISSPVSLTVANLNGDGKPDLVVASSDSGNLFLLQGNGNDQFTPLPYELAVGVGTSYVLAADFSGSSTSDLAAADPLAGTIKIFHFDGFGYRLVNTLQAGKTPQTLVAADFNGDGRLDLAAVSYGSDDVSVFLGNGNNTFEPATTDPTGAGPIGLATADFNGDGKPDLVTTDFIGLTVSVLLNNGDATFTSPPARPPSAGPNNVVAADLTGNGIDDLIVPDVGLDAVEVFLGRGDGTFRAPILIPTGSSPEDLAVGDFNGDGIPDLAVVNFAADTVMIFKGNGDGTFDPIETLATGSGPRSIKIGDLDGDGHPDLVVANFLGNTVDVFYGRGDGTFADAVSYPVGLGPSGIAISDLDGDGRPDLAVSDSGSNNVDVFMATGPRTYGAPVSYPAGDQPWSVAAGDFNNDGRPDLVVADGLTSVVSLLLNNGRGSFAPPVAFGVGVSPYELAVGDLTGDGNLDIVTGNDVSNNISVLIGRGNGTFQPAIELPSGNDPYGVAIGDFNDDGHPDIAAVNYQSSDLTIYLGNGDGTFSNSETIPLVSPDLPTITAYLEGNGVPQVLVANPEAGTISIFNSQGDGTLQLINTIDVGGSPSGMVVGDFNGDGRPDLAVTDASSGSVLILLGLGNGTFESPIRYNVGKSPTSPIVGDFNHDGSLDIAVADTNSNEVSVLYGRGDGTFQAALSFPVGQEPIELVIGGINADGGYDLGTVNRTSNNLSLLVGLPGGTFAGINYNLPGITTSIDATGDFDGDGTSDVIFIDEQTGTAAVELDYAEALETHFLGATGPVKVQLGVAPGNYLVTTADLSQNSQSSLILANTDTGVVTILSGWANDKFTRRSTIDTGTTIAGLAVVDLNNDGFPDILITEAGTDEVETYLSGGNGVFSPAESAVPLPHPSPLLFNQSSPGVTNIVNVNNSGQVLERFGIAGTTAEFDSPVNLTLGTGDTIRDYAVVQTGGIADVALLLENAPLLYIQSTVNVTASGRFPIALPGEGNYTRVISGDLFGTGLDDLVVINRTLDEIVIYQQRSSGVFQLYGHPISAGFGPTDVTLANLTPGGLPDLVVADGSSGTVTLIGRNSQGGFFDEATLPAGLATAGTVLLSSGLARTSPDEPVGVTSGVFGPSGLSDVVVVDHGTDRISILQGLPGGGLSAPSLALTYSTGLDPIQVIAAPLTKNGLLDLVVLNEGSDDISIFLNNGHGGFTALPRVDAGDNPASLALNDVTGDGIPDLVVSNTQGDILILAGNGDGTFQPYERADGTVSLAVGDLTGNGQNDFVLTNTAEDLLSVQTSSSTAGFLQGRGNGLLAPGPVAIADLTGNGIQDLIVTNTGGNDVLIYLGLGNGQFAAPQKFFTGTAPVGLTVADLTSNGLPDLIVANSGSNDVTILLGTIEPDGSWTMVPGPRLKAGDRPVSTTVADLYGNGQWEILVVNQDSNDITVLRPLGGGFYDDNDPLTLPTGQSPVQAFVGHFSSSIHPGIVVLNSRSNDMTYYPNIDSPALTISSGGIDPVAGVMGDFTTSGYDDLAVANNGDSRISLFYGGAAGLSLSQTILLGDSTHPTDLVVSASKEGNLQFFVGVEGQDHAIAVSVSDFTTIEVIVTAPTDGGLTNSNDLARLSSGNSSSSSQFNTVIFEQQVNVAASQSPESASSNATSSSASSAVSMTIAVVTTLTQAAQTLFSPSARSIVGLLDNLVQLAQGQTAEILPIGKNEMAAVAVLLSTSSMASPHEDNGLTPLPVPTEDDSSFIAFIPNDSEVAPPSRLDRFVADLGVSSLDLSQERLARPGPVPDFGAEWVWHRHPTDNLAITVNFEHGQKGHFSPALDAPATAIVVETNPGLDGSSDDATDLTSTPEPSFLGRIAIAGGSFIALGIGFLIARGLQKDTRLNRSRRPVGTTQLEPGSVRLQDWNRVDTVWSSTRSRNNTEDLPPWLQGPKSPKYRRNASDRSVAASLFRRRGPSQ